MIKIVSVEAMRRIEAAADAAGISYVTMMERAGTATAARVLLILDELQLADARVTVLVGTGNNGGDGLVAARVIAESGKAQVRIYQLKPRDEHDPHLQAVRQLGLFVADAVNDQQYRVLRNMVASTDILIDALFGIGLRLPLRNDAVKVLRNVQQAIHERNQTRVTTAFSTPHQPRSSSIPPLRVIAVDCPSGLDCDTGEIDKNAINADETITYIAAKPGLFKFPGAAAVGELHVASLDIPPDLPELAAEKCLLANGALAQRLLPPRPLDGHKGTFGKALIIGGSRHYLGAPGLSAAAAYRAGTGLVTVAASPKVVQVNAARLFEPTWLPLPSDGQQAAELLLKEAAGYDVLLIGPGWGRSEETRALLHTLLNPSLPPLVIDADGLNLLSELDNWSQRLPPNTILTPHPGEFARLAGINIDYVKSNRWELALEKSAKWNVVLVAKGAHTVIAAPDGQLTALPFKTDALATAGTGDILAGLIVGFLAQGLKPYDAAVLGAYVQGLAGQNAGKTAHSRRATIASDILAEIGRAFELIENDAVV